MSSCSDSDTEVAHGGRESSQSPSPALSDEELRKLLVPQPESDEQLLAIVRTHYDVPTLRVAQRLDSYDDANYLLEADSGTKYLLKVHNGVESREYLAASCGGEFYAPGRMSSAIHLQNAIMELCYEHGLRTSRPIPVRKTPGDAAAAVAKPSPVCVARLPVLSEPHGPCDLVLRLLTWVSGVPMSTVVHLPLEALADAGRYLGRLNRVLDNISAAALSGALQRVGSSAALLGPRPAGFVRRGDAPSPASGTSNDSFLTAVATASRKRSMSLDRLRAHLGMEEREGAVLDESLLIPANRYHQWDTKNTSDLRSYLEYITDSKRRGMVESIIEAFEKRLIKSGIAANFRTGVNHGDFNDANILVDSTMTVCGAIDFGDSVRSWRVLDVAVAMAYAMMSPYGKKNRSLSAAAGVLRGYNAIYPLTEQEREHLPLLMACRLACSVTLGAYAYHQNPANKYLLFHAEPGWKTLEMIWGYDATNREKLADAARGLFNQACLYSDPREKILTCYDLVIPDPSVADLLASVRVMSIDNNWHLPAKRRKMKGDGIIPLIAFAYKDAKHFAEAKRLLQPHEADRTGSRIEYHIEPQEIALPAFEGDITTIARHQCAAAAEQAGSAVIIEVSGLCLNALGGLPGAHTRAFLDGCGVKGLVQMLSAFEDKGAYAQTVVCFSSDPGCDPVFFDGRTYGCIVPPRGGSGFDFDSIFQPNEGSGKTFAEMSTDEKDAISHRSRAFSQLHSYLHKFEA